MCGIARIFEHAYFRLWLQADYPATSPARLLNPQQQTFWTRLGMSQVDPSETCEAMGHALMG